MRRTVSFVLLALWASLAAAQDGARYVSDEIQIVLRDAPRNDGAPRGVVGSGTRVSVLARDEASGYVRVRADGNREGWMLERHLKSEPAARDRAQRAEKALAAAQSELQKLRDEHTRVLADFARLSGGEPMASREVLAEAETLRAQLKAKDIEVASMAERHDVERARQKTLLLGAALVAVGMLLALLLRWAWPKRRWGDF
ncbi:MAG TPA: TIGR04211 family SH3 domain-containing protein [Verrucomicrobiae bacterium]|nr:TIGR04211 family SH3 domain-containing protein [Verrucomicrobiae bacterium]